VRRQNSNLFFTHHPVIVQHLLHCDTSPAPGEFEGEEPGKKEMHFLPITTFMRTYRLMPVVSS